MIIETDFCHRLASYSLNPTIYLLFLITFVTLQLMHLFI